MPRSPRLTPDQLTEIRQNTNWRSLFEALQIEKDPHKSQDADWWGKSPFNPQEHTASFHMNPKGWYCHSSDQGGGPIELVQRLHPGMTCYRAGRWLLDHGISRIVEAVRDSVEGTSEAGDQKEEGPALLPVAPDASAEDYTAPQNPPIRQDLRRFLQPDHPTFTDRGITPAVLDALGAGFLQRQPRKNGKADPMNERLVFQIRGLAPDDDGDLREVILGHIGRATTPEQAEEFGKWWTYRGFRKSLELYGLPLLLTDDLAREQARETGRLLLVEGCFDLAKLLAGGIRNVVASFGSHLSSAQVERLRFLLTALDIREVQMFYDRDEAGRNGTTEAMAALTEAGFSATAFDWERQFSSPRSGREGIGIPDSISDPCDFSAGQLQWLRMEGVI